MCLSSALVASGFEELCGLYLRQVLDLSIPLPGVISEALDIIIFRLLADNVSTHRPADFNSNLSGNLPHRYIDRH